MNDFKSFFSNVTNKHSNLLLTETGKQLVQSVEFAFSAQGEPETNNVDLGFFDPGASEAERLEMYLVYQDIVLELFQVIENKALALLVANQRVKIDPVFVEIYKERYLKLIKAIVLDDPAIDPALDKVLPHSKLPTGHYPLVRLGYQVVLGNEYYWLALGIVVWEMEPTDSGGAVATTVIYNSRDEKLGM